MVMVRRTRSYIKDVYPDDLINGVPIKFPKHEYSAIKYNLSELFGNIFEKILNTIDSLTMAPYGIEQYNMDIKDKNEKNKHRVLGHLQIILILKRFESSTEAVRISLENKIRMYEYVRRILDAGKILRVKDFNYIMLKWNRIETEDDSDPDVILDDEQEDFFIKELQNIKTETAGKNYDIGKLKNDMDQDLEKLHYLLDEVNKISVDAKLDAVVRMILKERVLENESKKILIFTEYTATAKYITKKFTKEFFTDKNVQCITGRTDQKTRKKYLRRFAPKANLLEDETLDKPEIDILISTEVLSEGQNLQDCNYVINYDLPWNPMRIVQRTGRIDRLTSTYDVIHSRACYPDAELDDILELVGKLISKIGVVNDTVGLEVELLGRTAYS